MFPVHILLERQLGRPRLPYKRILVARLLRLPRPISASAQIATVGVGQLVVELLVFDAILPLTASDKLVLLYVRKAFVGPCRVAVYGRPPFLVAVLFLVLGVVEIYARLISAFHY